MIEQMKTERQRVRLIALQILIALLSMPLILKLVPPNGFYGFRTPVTMSSRDVWYPANAFAGWALLIAASIAGAVLWILPATVKRWMLWATYLIPLLSALTASLVYLNRHG